jgi:hypothetical protein
VILFRLSIYLLKLCWNIFRWRKYWRNLEVSLFQWYSILRRWLHFLIESGYRLLSSSSYFLLHLWPHIY